MKVIPLSFCFKGERDYLHGTDVYEAVADVARQRVGEDLQRLRLGMHRFFRRQPDLYWSAEAAAARPPNAIADFSTSGVRDCASGWLLESERPVECRKPFDEDRVRYGCAFADASVSVRASTGLSPIETLVSMTKHLHNRVVPAATARWIFSRLDVRRLLRPEDAAGLTVRLVDNLHGRLTRCDIEVGGEALGQIYFSLARA
jgi:hypothetical protein